MMKVPGLISKIITDKRYEHYLFVQFLIWVSLPLLIMTAITYYIYIHGEEAKNQYMIEAYASQMEDTCGSYFTNIKEYYLDVTKSEIYQQLLVRQSLPWDALDELSDFQKVLAGGRSENAVKSYCFINARYRWVLCNYGMYPMENLKNEGEVQSFITELKDTPGDILWMNHQELSSPYQNGIVGYGYADISGQLMILKSVNFLGELEGVLIIQMRLADIEKSMRMYSNLGYETLIIDRNEILLGAETGYAQKYLMKHGQNMEYDPRSEKRYQVMETYDEANGLSYLIAFDTDQNRKRALSLVRSAGIFIAAYIILTLILRRVTMKASEPFWKLKKNNEEQQEKIKEFFVMNLLKGTWEEERIKRYMEKYEWETLNGYRLLLIGVESNEDEMEKIHAMLLKKEGSDYFIIPVKYRSYLAVIVGAEDEMQVEFKAAVLFQAISHYAEDSLTGAMRVGVSGYFTSLQSCSTAVNQCLEAMMYSRQKDQKSVLTVYDDLSFKTRDEENRPLSEEEELYETIAEKNREKSVELLHDILQNTNHKNIWGIDRSISVYRLLMNILAIPQKEEIPLSEIFPDNSRDIFDLREKIFNNEELEHYICYEIMLPVIEALGRSEGSKDAELVKKAMRMIKERRGDITLTECADYLECHPSYLSRIIKKERGVGFQDLLNDEKLEKAKHLLNTTAVSVAEIAQMTGYQNAQNFIRFFKSQTGMTPAKYRKGFDNE